MALVKLYIIMETLYENGEEVREYPIRVYKNRRSACNYIRNVLKLKHKRIEEEWSWAIKAVPAYL